MARNPFESADEIRNPAISIQKLMEYANGAAPDVVPPVLALSELARRKKITESAMASKQAPQVNQESPTIKEQTEQQIGLLALKQQQANRAQQAIGLPPVQQGQAPQMPVQQMASGGLARIPVDRLFRAKSYAGGGIVAFNDNKDQPVNTLMPGEESGIPKDEKEDRNKRLQDYIFDYLRTKPQAPISAEAALKRRYELERMANSRLGVPEGPEGKNLEEAYKKLADRQNKYYEDALSPTSQLIEFGRKFASADPTKGFGVWGAEAAGASSKYRREMQREQMKADMEIALGMSKIEDARRKRAEGDVDGAIKAEADAKKLFEDAQKNRANVAENTIQSQNTAARAAKDDTANLIVQEIGRIRTAEAKKLPSQRMTEEQIAEQARRNVELAKGRAATNAAPTNSDPLGLRK